MEPTLPDGCSIDRKLQGAAPGPNLCYADRGGPSGPALRLATQKLGATERQPRLAVYTHVPRHGDHRRGSLVREDLLGRRFVGMQGRLW